MPPAVPTGEPPINIKSRQTIADAFVKCSCGTVANPAVLVVTDWNNDIWILSHKDMPCKVKGLLYSKAKIAIAPPKIRMAVEVKTILLWSVSV